MDNCRLQLCSCCHCCCCCCCCLRRRRLHCVVFAHIVSKAHRQHFVSFRLALARFARQSDSHWCLVSPSLPPVRLSAHTAVASCALHRHRLTLQSEIEHPPPPAPARHPSHANYLVWGRSSLLCFASRRSRCRRHSLAQAIFIRRSAS